MVLISSCYVNSLTLKTQICDMILCVCMGKQSMGRVLKLFVFEFQSVCVAFFNLTSVFSFFVGCDCW